jgi:hypothetical protein
MQLIAPVMLSLTAVWRSAQVRICPRSSIHGVCDSQLATLGFAFSSFAQLRQFDLADLLAAASICLLQASVPLFLPTLDVK